MKRFFAFFLIIFLFLNISIVNAANEWWSCELQWKIDECNSALKRYIRGDGTFITPGASLREIEDFVCLQDAPEKRVFQIALWENHKIIDEEMDKYLAALSDSKSEYFWKDAKFNYSDWVNHIHEKHAYFKNSFYSACTKSVIDASTCIENVAYTLPEDRPSLWIEAATEFVKGSGGDCYRLSDIKGDIFKSVAYNVLVLNQQQVAQDQKKLYDQEIRTKYDRIVELMMINIWYVERIWMKTPSFTRNTYK